MALTQSSSRWVTSDNAGHVSKRRRTSTYPSKEEGSVIRKSSSGDTKGSSERIANQNKVKNAKGAERRGSTPPTPATERFAETPPRLPTPPWLTTSLPSTSSLEREYSSIRSTADAPEEGDSVPQPPFARYVASGEDSAGGGHPPGEDEDPSSVDEQVEASLLFPRVRSMSPPEMDLHGDYDDEEPDQPPEILMQALGPLTCTTLSVNDAVQLRTQLAHDPHRLTVLGNILKSMTDLMMPNHDMVWNLLVVTEGGYNCPFPQCPRHKEGWSRADRTRAHIYADHLLIRYKCDKCQSFFKREQDFNIHVAGHDKQPAFECSLCNKTFPKKFNLNRHLRQIHDQNPVTKVRNPATKEA